MTVEVKLCKLNNFEVFTISYHSINKEIIISESHRNDLIRKREVDKIKLTLHEIKEIIFKIKPFCIVIYEELCLYFRSPGRWQYKTTSKPRVTIRKQNGDEMLNTNNNETLGATSPSFSTSQDISQGLVNEVVTPQARSDDVDSLEGSESIASIIDDESSSENKVDTPAFPIETIKVEISTPPDFTDVYYEIATIKSPYTFQVTR